MEGDRTGIVNCGTEVMDALTIVAINSNDQLPGCDQTSFCSLPTAFL